MTLLEAVQTTKCDVLRTELEKFISLIAGQVIPTVHCPICRAHLTESYQDQSNQEKFPGQGTCMRCHLQIQMRHDITHQDHMLDPVTKELCSYRVTMPVMMLQPVIAKLLRDKWVAMRMPGRPLTREEDMNWIVEAKALVKKYSIN